MSAAIGMLSAPELIVARRFMKSTLGFVLLALFAFGCLGLNYLVFVGHARKSLSYQT